MSYPDSRRQGPQGARIGLGVVLLFLLLAVCSVHPGYAMGPATGPGAHAQDGTLASTARVWSSEVWTSVAAQWAAFWSPVRNAFRTVTGSSTTATTTDGSPTDGTGGFTPGGGGGFIDPNGST